MTIAKVIAFKLEATEQNEWQLALRFNLGKGVMLNAVDLNLNTKELEDLYAEIGQALEKADTLRVELIELVNWIADYQGYITFDDPPAGCTAEEERLHCLKHDHDLVQLIEAKAKALQARMKDEDKI